MAAGRAVTQRDTTRRPARPSTKTCWQERSRSARKSWRRRWNKPGKWTRIRPDNSQWANGLRHGSRTTRNPPSGKLTAAYYKNYIDKHIIPNIGKIKLDKLTTLDSQRFYNKAKTKGRVKRYEGMKDLSLSAKTIRGLHAMLRQCLDQAVQERLIPYNPAAGCKLPPKEKKEMRTLPTEKISAYLTAAEEHGVLPMFYLELTTGLRRGELVALLWDDLDMENQTLTVNKSAGRINGEVKVTQPKTANSVRTICLPKETVALLIQKHAKHPGNPVMFPSPATGRLYGPDCLGRLHKNLLKKAGITENIPFHGLRHTFATLAIQHGVDAKTVSSILGHYSAGFTLDTYTHVTGEMQKEAAQRMGSFMALAVGKTQKKKEEVPSNLARYFLKISGLGLVWVKTESCKF